MGKGDKKSAKGKRFMGSYGKTRLKKFSPKYVASAEVPKEKEKLKETKEEKVAEKASVAKKAPAAKKKSPVKKAPAKKKAE
jgi:30S ribosomal protein S31